MCVLVCVCVCVCVCVWGELYEWGEWGEGSHAYGGGDLRPPGPVICKSHEL